MEAAADPELDKVYRVLQIQTACHIRARMLCVTVLSKSRHCLRMVGHTHSGAWQDAVASGHARLLASSKKAVEEMVFGCAVLPVPEDATEGGS
eukprot:3938173-Rhodomonas_salina.2